MKHVGLIGAGRIAPFYIDVLRDFKDVNVSIAASDQSLSAKKMSEAYKIKYFEYAQELIEQNDFIIVACKTSEIRKYVEIADTFDKQILAEKPLLEDTEQKLNLLNPGNLMIGYNRRYYRAVQRMNSTLKDQTNRFTINMEFPERLGSKAEGKYFPLQSNGVHAIDLADYLTGGIVSYEIDEFSSINERILRIKGMRHNALLSFKLKCHAGTKIWYHDDSATHVLAPIEQYKAYSSMEIIEADIEGVKVRNYIPMMSENSVIDDRGLKYKAGFEGQIRAFLYGKHIVEGASVQKCQLYLEIIEKLKDEKILRFKNTSKRSVPSIRSNLIGNSTK
jgi:predicted dehydrogenase